MPRDGTPRIRSWLAPSDRHAVAASTASTADTADTADTVATADTATASTASTASTSAGSPGWLVDPAFSRAIPLSANDSGSTLLSQRPLSGVFAEIALAAEASTTPSPPPISAFDVLIGATSQAAAAATVAASQVAAAAAVDASRVAAASPFASASKPVADTATATSVVVVVVSVVIFGTYVLRSRWWKQKRTYVLRSTWWKQKRRAYRRWRNGCIGGWLGTGRHSEAVGEDSQESTVEEERPERHVLRSRLLSCCLQKTPLRSLASRLQKHMKLTPANKSARKRMSKTKKKKRTESHSLLKPESFILQEPGLADGGDIEAIDPTSSEAAAEGGGGGGLWYES